YLIAFFFFCTCVYPIVATRARVADRWQNPSPIGWTLDGTAYMNTATYRDDVKEAAKPGELHLGTDLKAFQWIGDNVPGSPVIAEGNTEPHLYRWGSRVSIYTGLPSIIGWSWHQTQQRLAFRNLIDERIRDVRTLYTDPSPERAMAIIAR